ncbi:MAG: acetyl-CoA C-acyltransferase [Betaproteobacteria bacterium]|nr:acetyl-CoA C-acyltransferase [Betaproteobacteria bacterium]MSQ89699.1 acetyl-CoA C-acyltransferase [Betaproteobacteria bacterium]
MSTRAVVVVAGARTAIGGYGGSLKDTAPTKLGAITIKEAVARAKIDPASVGHVVMGSVIHGEARDMYLSRVAAIDAGLSVGTPCLTVNRLCGSGLQAIVSAAQHILLGDTEVVVAGGAESMSRAAYFLPAGRWGQRMGDGVVVDAMTAALHDPFGNGHMGITAENVAAKFGFTREQQDAYALESHQRAGKALAQGFFKDQIVPVELKTRKGVEQFTTDEHVRKDVKLEDLQKLKAVFKKDGTVTAGNASGLNDAGAAIVMVEENYAQKQNLRPLARMLAYAHAGVEPQLMGLGPIPAVKRVFEKAGLKPADMDVIESNEAFAAQAMAVTQDLGLDPAKVNPNGGAVALGHPIGATGAILTVKAIYELQRTQKRYALVTMCIGGGQGIAAIFERV